MVLQSFTWWTWRQKAPYAKILNSLRTDAVMITFITVLTCSRNSKIKISVSFLFSLISYSLWNQIKSWHSELVESTWFSRFSEPNITQTLFSVPGQSWVPGALRPDNHLCILSLSVESEVSLAILCLCKSYRSSRLLSMATSSWSHPKPFIQETLCYLCPRNHQLLWQHPSSQQETCVLIFWYMPGNVSETEDTKRKTLPY